MYGREGRKETYCRRLSIRTRSHHMILMTIKASLFSLFQQPEQKKEQLKPGMGFHGVCDWCSILFRKNKHMLCYNRVHRRPRKQVRVRRPFEASDSRAPVVCVCAWLAIHPGLLRLQTFLGPRLRVCEGVNGTRCTMDYEDTESCARRSSSSLAIFFQAHAAQASH